MALTAAVSKEDHEYVVSKVKISGFGFYFQILLYLSKEALEKGTKIHL